MPEYKGLSVTFEGDTTDMAAALHRISVAGQEAQGNLTGVNNALKFDNSARVSLLQSRAKNMGSAFKASQDRVNVFDQAIKKNRDTLNTTSTALQKMRDAGLENSSIYKTLEAGVESLNGEYAHLQEEQDKNIASMERARSQLLTYNAELQKASTAWGRFGGSMQSGGNALVGLGDKLSGITRMVGNLELVGRIFDVPINPSSIISATEDFGNKISQLGGYLDVSGAALDEMEGLALKWGKDTKYSAGEAADAMSELAKGGMTTAQIKAGALNSTMLLASAGNLSMADAAEVAVQAIKVFGLSAQDSSKVADALAGAANKSTAEVDSLAHAFKYVGGWANLANWDINDVSGALALLSDHGLQGEMAGTALRNVMQRLAAPTDTAAKLMEKYGVEVRDADGKMKSATDVIDELNTKLGDLPSDEKDNVLNKIFGARALPAAIALMSEGSAGLQDYIDATKNAGYASEMAQAQLGELGWALEYLRGEAETAQVNIGGALEPSLISLAHTVEGVLEWFNSLDDAQRRSVVSFGMMAVAAGPVLTIMGHLASGIGTAVSFVGGFLTVTKGLSGSAATVTILERMSAGFVATGMSAEAAAAKTAAFRSTMVGLGIMGAVAGVAALAWAFWDENKAARDSAKRTREVGEAARTAHTAFGLMTGSVKSDASALDGYGTSARTAARSVSDVIDSMKSHADAARSSADEMAANNHMLDRYRDVIASAAGAGEGWSGSMSELRAALKYLEEQTGATYDAQTVLNGSYTDEEGAIHNVLDEIDQLIAKRKEEARVAALTDAYKNAYQDQIDLSRTASEAESKYYASRQRWIDIGISRNMDYADAVSYANEMMMKGDKNERQLYHDWKDSAAALQENTQILGEYESALDGATQAEADGEHVRENRIKSSAIMSGAIQGMSFDARQLAEAMQAAGVSTEQFDGVSEESFRRLTVVAGDNMGYLVWLIQHYNELPIDPKTGEVSVDDLQLVDAMGQLVVWNGAEFVNKETGVHVDMGDVHVATGDIQDYNAAAGGMKDPQSTARVNYSSVEQGTRAINTFETVPFGYRVSTASTSYGTVTAANAAMRINQNMTFRDRQNTITTIYETKHVEHAAGGFIPKHAAGGYIDRATLTANGIVGEAGVEYYDGSSIIPLTNRHYAQPFIDLLSKGVGEQLGGAGGGPTYNLYIDRAVVNGDEEIQSAMLGLFDVLRRKGDMNRG